MSEDNSKLNTTDTNNLQQSQLNTNNQTESQHQNLQNLTNYQTNSSNYQTPTNFHQNAPKYSEFLIVSAPVPAIIDEQRDLVEITRVENPAYKANATNFQHHQQYSQQLHLHV